MKKKLLSLLLVLVMAAALLPTAAFAGNTTQVITNENDPWRQYYTYDNYDPVTHDSGLYQLHATCDEELGSVTFNRTRANEGDTIYVQIYPAYGCTISQVFILWDGEWVNKGAVSSLQFAMPDHSVEVDVRFVRIEDGEHSLGYSVSPNKAADVWFTDANGYTTYSADYGEEVTIHADAAAGYSIDYVTCNFMSGYVYGYYYEDGDSFTYTFNMPNQDVVFYIYTVNGGTYTVTVSNSNNYYGTVYVQNNVEKADRGDTVTFTVSPSYQYKLKSVAVYTNDSYRSNVQVTRDKYNWNTFSFTMPAANVVIAPTYTSDYYTVSVDADSHGTVSVEAEPAGTNAYYGIKNEYVYVTADPNTGYKVKSVTVYDKYNDSIKVYETSTSGRYYFTMPDCNVTVKVEFTPRTMTNPFTDVRSTDWFYDAVNYVYSEGIMDGTSVYMFSPNNATSRGMLVTILWRLAGEPVVTGTSFSDVSSSSYYYYAVLWASKYGIVDGVGNNKFAPDQAITREQFAVILYRYAQHCGYSTSASSMLTGYADSNKISSYALTAMRWACGAGLFEGDERANLSPQGQTTRAAAAKLLMTFDEKVA